MVAQKTDRFDDLVGMNIDGNLCGELSSSLSMKYNFWNGLRAHSDHEDMV